MAVPILYRSGAMRPRNRVSAFLEVSDRKREIFFISLFPDLRNARDAAFEFRLVAAMAMPQLEVLPDSAFSLGAREILEDPKIDLWALRHQICELAWLTTLDVSDLLSLHSNFTKCKLYKDFCLTE